MQNVIRYLILLSLFLLAIHPAFAAEPALGDILTGKLTPLTLSAKELTGEWLCLTIGAKAENPADMYTMMRFGMQGGPAAPATFYTRGTVVTVGTECFLIAYEPPRPAGPSMMEMMRHRHGDEPNLPTVAQFLAGRLPQDAVLTLSLFNLREVSSISNIRPFDPAKELVTPEDIRAAEKKLAEEKAKAGYARSISQLRQLATAALMYVQDNNGNFPPLDTEEEMRASIGQYLGNEEMFINPIDDKPYMANPHMSKAKEADIKNPTETVLIYEATPAPDGTRGVAYCDGHAKRVNDAEWQKIKKANKIP